MAAKPKTSTVPIDSIQPHPDNPRKGDVAAIVKSIRVNGVYRPVVVHRDTGNILAGNHTWKAQKEDGREAVDVWWFDGDEEAARRVMLDDNHIADMGDYDLRLLLENLALVEVNDTSFTLDDLAKLEADLAALDAEDGDTDAPPTPNDLETLLNSTWGEPKHEPAHGSVWQVGIHVLVVARPTDEWGVWLPYLTEGAVLAIYPDPYLTVGKKAEGGQRLLMVQPNRYLAGHLLDKHEQAHPGEVARR